jgi:hypothetical protein
LHERSHGCRSLWAAALFLDEVAAGAVGVAGNPMTGPGAAGDAGRFQVDAPEHGLAVRTPAPVKAATTMAVTGIIGTRFLVELWRVQLRGVAGVRFLSGG